MRLVRFLRLVYPLRLLLFLAILGCSSKAAPDPIWIGHLLPLPEDNRILAQHARQGVELAVAEAQDAAQTITGRSYAVLSVESSNESTAVQATTTRLLTANYTVALLANFDASQTERLIRTSQVYGVPVIVPGELPHPTHLDTVVSLGVPPAVRGQMLARYASTELKCSRVAILTDNRLPIATAFANAFLMAWPNRRNRTSEEWTFTTTAQRDEHVNHIIQAAPAVVVLACSVADFRLLLPRLAAALPNVPLIYGGEDVGTTGLRTELETHSEVYLATAYSPDHLSDRGRAFARHYEERYHEVPDLYAAQSYDAARLLLEALQRVGKASRDALGTELAHLEQFDSITGPIFWKGRQPHRRVFLIALKNNQANVIASIDAEAN